MPMQPTAAWKNTVSLKGVEIIGRSWLDAALIKNGKDAPLYGSTDDAVCSCPVKQRKSRNLSAEYQLHSQESVSRASSEIQ